MKFLKRLGLVSTLLFLSGCGSSLRNNSYLVLRDINLGGQKYSTDSNRLKQEGVADDEMRFGVVSDIHGDGEKARKIASRFGELGLNSVIIAGDVSRRFSDSEKVPEVEEIRASLIPFLELGKPVYVIAGNHETKKVYFQTVGELSRQYHNLFDLSTLKYADLKGVNIFGVSGGIFTPSGGFKVKKQIRSVDDSVFTLDDDPVLMVSHMPERFDYKGAIDEAYGIMVDGKKISGRHKAEAMIYDGVSFERIKRKNSGLKELTDLVRDRGVAFSVSGHLHMNRGAGDFTGVIPEGKYSPKLFMSSGAAQYDMAGVLTIQDGKAKYELLEIK